MFQILPTFSLQYTYDPIGNITQIANATRNLTAATTTYAYDALYRLITASTTLASSTPFKHSFAYSPIGNILGMSTTTGATTTYTYAETGYTNPHAPTTIGSQTLTYDNNGNVTTKGTTAYIWDYRNRMTATGQGGATTTYTYDHTYERVKKVSPSTTTYYPNDLYSKEGATTTRFIYGNGELLATIEGNGTATSTQYHHQDHLGSTRLVTNNLGVGVQALDYYPYGSRRISNGSTNVPRQFIGEVFDPSTNLNYLNARYYDSSRGQFTSQDPVFWGDQNLANPQSMNSYSYAENNPINKKDSTGNQAASATQLAKAATILKLARTILIISGATLSAPEIAVVVGAVAVAGAIIKTASTASKNAKNTMAGQSSPTPTLTVQSNSNPTSFNPNLSSPTYNSINNQTSVTTPYTTVPISNSYNTPVISSGQSQSSMKPKDAPSGTVPIDQAGLPRDVIHKIKNDVGQGATDWTGVSPQGDVITTGPNGESVNQGPVENWRQSGNK